MGLWHVYPESAAKGLWTTPSDFALFLCDILTSATGTPGKLLSPVWARVLLSPQVENFGFGFLAVVISYLPVLYQAFSRREITISLLDARAGSPPTAGELLRRLAAGRSPAGVGPFLVEWERWSAELLESHLSYPFLAYFRSHHENQSWLGALTTMLDVTALVITGVKGLHNEQAKLTFAMARHAAVDLAQVVKGEYDPHGPNRLASGDLEQLRRAVAQRGVALSDAKNAEEKLAELRALYEPYLHALARRLEMTVPPWFVVEHKKDNWQSGPWDRAIQARSLERPGRAVEEHF